MAAAAAAEPYEIDADLFFKSTYISPTTIREHITTTAYVFHLPLDGGDTLLELYTPTGRNFKITMGDCTLASKDGRVKIFDGLPITGQVRHPPKITGLPAGTPVHAVFETYPPAAGAVIAGTPPTRETNYGLKVRAGRIIYQVRGRTDPGTSVNTLHLAGISPA